MKGGLTAALIVAVASWPVVRVQQHIDAWRDHTPASQELLYIPQGEYLRVAVLGYETVTADLLWLRAISLFGERFKQDADPIWVEWLHRMVDVATDLDPLDHRMYLYGGLMIKAEGGHIDKVAHLFEKGSRNVDDRFFLPMAAAMVAYQDKKDLPKAIEYMRLASTRPDAPPYIKALTATMMQLNRQEEVALAFLEEELKVLPAGSETWKAVHMEYTEASYEYLRKKLNEAVQRFETSFGRKPTSVEELVGVTLRALPTQPFGGRWVLHPLSGQIYGDNAFAEINAMRKSYGFKPLKVDPANPVMPTGGKAATEEATP